MLWSVTTKYVFEALLYLNLKSPKLDLQVMNYGGLGNFKESDCLFRLCQVVAWVRLLLLIKEGWATIKVLLDCTRGRYLMPFQHRPDVNTARLLWSSQAGWRFSSNVWTSFMRHLKWIHQPGGREAQTGPCTLLSPWGKEAPYQLYFLCPIHHKTPGRWE